MRHKRADPRHGEPSAAIEPRNGALDDPAFGQDHKSADLIGTFDDVQARLDKNPDAMRTRRETVEHPFGTLKMRMGATHFLMKTLPKVATEMALHVLAYNLTRVMNIIGIKPFLAAIRA